MKHFIDRLSGSVYAYESDGSQDAYIKEGLELLSGKELSEIRAAQEAASMPTPEQVLHSANSRRDELLAIAGLRIAPLQDAADLGKATPEEISYLSSWKEYRIEVSRISDQSEFPVIIKWPDSPENRGA